jgi:polyisoprenoid-binding protein YceI
MKKIKLLIAICLLFSTVSHAQLYMTRNGEISFFSSTPLEDIKAKNQQVYAIIDVAKKNLAFSTLMRGFNFPKALMQEHFNENYVESDKFPKATFNGSYTGDIDPAKDGSYKIQVQGVINMHGQNKSISIPATVDVKGGVLTAKTDFKLKPSDFKIDIPSLVKDKISNEIAVSVSAVCTKK